jgi:hypothetical protein
MEEIASKQPLILWIGEDNLWAKRKRFSPKKRSFPQKIGGFSTVINNLSREICGFDQVFPLQLGVARESLPCLLGIGACGKLVFDLVYPRP